MKIKTSLFWYPGDLVLMCLSMSPNGLVGVICKNIYHIEPMENVGEAKTQIRAVDILIYYNQSKI